MNGYEITDLCEDVHCQFLAANSPRPEAVHCSLARLLCDVRGPFGLVQTGDEAMMLQQYLLLSGAEHFPMLIPQASILKGKRRPDFLAFAPLSRFQYHKVVVLIDRPGKDDARVKAENEEYEREGFLVQRILIDGTSSYFKRARDLVLWLSRL